MTVALNALGQQPALESAEIPPLEFGDRLTQAEFERRYAAMPDVKKAELIEGVVYMPSPVSFRKHGQPHARLIMWLGEYIVDTPGVEAADNSTIRLDLDNEPQPDVILFINPARGGQAKISEDDFVEGAPELVAEVTASRESYDAHVKLQVYRRSGIREYILWRVRDRQIDWFVLREGAYVPLTPDAEGLYHSETFPGLALDPAALIAGDLKTVKARQRQALDSPEHQAFLQRLQSSNPQA